MHAPTVYDTRLADHLSYSYSSYSAFHTFHQIFFWFLLAKMTKILVLPLLTQKREEGNVCTVKMYIMQKGQLSPESGKFLFILTSIVLIK